ncbi:MAG: hypothetical protein BMS9Abin13_068 [Patescibacteria group bacterium]|nr:MAG: hypothetical protein BMS9Abin13_068 [Patescibacteria group bacterium]
MVKNETFIIKASGEKELFSEEKLRRSLRRSGAPANVVDVVMDRIRDELADGMTTSNIYRRAFDILKRNKKTIAMRYSLRQAVMQMGPTGFPFEKLVGEILKKQGYDVKVGVVMAGHCVSHEIDVLAKKQRKHIIVEAKFHNQLGIKTDLKVALYVQARFEDIRKKREEKYVKQEREHEAWLITNTKLTAEAVRYSKCMGMRAIGWNYPRWGNLQDLIASSDVHPLTCLTTLSTGHKRQLFEKGVVLCRELLEDKSALKTLGITDKKIRDVLEEIKLICRDVIGLDAA